MKSYGPHMFEVTPGISTGKSPTRRLHLHFKGTSICKGLLWLASHSEHPAGLHHSPHIPSKFTRFTRNLNHSSAWRSAVYWMPIDRICPTSRVEKLGILTWTNYSNFWLSERFFFAGIALHSPMQSSSRLDGDRIPLSHFVTHFSTSLWRAPLQTLVHGVRLASQRSYA